MAHLIFLVSLQSHPIERGSHILRQTRVLQPINFDTHTHTETFDFDVAERPSRPLRGQARQTLWSGLKGCGLMPHLQLEETHRERERASSGGIHALQVPRPPAWPQSLQLLAALPQQRGPQRTQRLGEVSHRSCPWSFQF